MTKDITTISEDNKYKLVCSSEYWFDCAKWSDRYTIYKLVKNWRGKYTWKPITYWTPYGNFNIAGDMEWAKKIAKDLDIEIPKPDRSKL